jgi:hypothetical protein
MINKLYKHHYERGGTEAVWDPVWAPLVCSLSLVTKARLASWTSDPWVQMPQKCEAKTSKNGGKSCITDRRFFLHFRNCRFQDFELFVFCKGWGYSDKMCHRHLPTCSPDTPILILNRSTLHGVKSQQQRGLLNKIKARCDRAYHCLPPLYFWCLNLSLLWCDLCHPFTASHA